MFPVLVRHYLKKLKNLSLFNKRNILFIFLLLYVATFTLILKYQSKYHNDSKISGKIIDYQKKNDLLKITIKGKEKIIASYYGDKNIDISYGDYIIAYGKMVKPSNNTIPNTFNYREYLYNHKIYNTFIIDDYKIKKNNNILYSLKNWFYKRSNSLKSYKYIDALFLGDKSYLNEEELSTIKNVGIMHLFAISGLHISYLINIINKLLKKLNKYIKNILIILLMILYSFIIGFPPSVLRVIMCYIIKFVVDLLKYNISNLKVLFISAFVLLLFNPFYIFDLGFIFSYTLMFFLLYKRVNEKNKIKNLIKLSSYAFLVSSPIIIYNFYNINLLSLLVNIFATPIISLILFPLTIITFIAPIFDNILLWAFSIFIKLCNIFGSISLFNISFAKPNLLLILLFYILIFAFCNTRKIKYIFIIIILLIINNIGSPNPKIIFFDVGQGDSSVIISPFNKETILIDTGGKALYQKSKNNYYTQNIILFFKSVGIKRINYLIMTHGDFDHMGEAINLVENFKVEKVVFNCGPYNDLEQELIKALDKKKIKYYSCIKELNIDKNKLYFLQTKVYDNENDNSNVIYTELNGYKFMFMGDASTTTEKEIMSKYNLPNIDVLKVGHHGSKTSSSNEFINKINPKYSVISVGKNNRYGHPNKEVLENLKNSKVYRIDEDGSIMFKIKNNKLKIETCVP